MTARSMPEGYEHPDRSIGADTSTLEGTDAVATRLAEAGGTLDIIVHVVGGSGRDTARPVIPARGRAGSSPVIAATAVPTAMLSVPVTGGGSS